jgi:hypothetical protein
VSYRNGYSMGDASHRGEVACQAESGRLRSEEDCYVCCCVSEEDEESGVRVHGA